MKLAGFKNCGIPARHFRARLFPRPFLARPEGSGVQTSPWLYSQALTQLAVACNPHQLGVCSGVSCCGAVGSASRETDPMQAAGLPAHWFDVDHTRYPPYQPTTCHVLMCGVLCIVCRGRCGCGCWSVWPRTSWEARQWGCAHCTNTRRHCDTLPGRFCLESCDCAAGHVTVQQVMWLCSRSCDCTAGHVTV